MTNSRSIIGIAVVAGILFFAIWLGVSIVTEQIETLAIVTGASILIVCALLGKRIWLIVPIFGSVNLTLMIPGQPSTMILGQALFILFCTLLFLMKQLQFRFTFNELSLWMLLLTACVIQTYLRNPVGLNIFGGQSVGAKPYALFAIALVSSLILGGLRVNEMDLRWVIRLSILGGIINFVMLSVGFFLPQIGVWYGAVTQSTVAETNIDRGAYGSNTASRIGFLGNASRNLSLGVSSFKSPIRACFHPLWAPLVLISLAFAALSGFRNEIGAVGLTYIVAIAYRGGFASVAMAGFALFAGIVMLALFNTIVPLPSNIQRSLSFLPGTWDEEQVKDSQDSTEWRVEMWKEALLTDYWIQDKFLGDGLGMSQQEFNYIQSFQGKAIGGSVGSGKLTLQQEFMMAAGNYHSGPVGTIRTIGYLGLLILVLAQIRLAVHAHRQIKRAKNTEWFPLTLWIGIPLIWAPIFFVFVFGNFGPAAASFLMGAAFVRLLENNLPLTPYKIHKRQPFILGQQPRIASPHP